MIESFFDNALATNALSHAYLFVGPNAQVQLETAKKLASAVVEKDLSGKGVSDLARIAATTDAAMISAGTHPDVREYAPASASGYLSEQIEELIKDVHLAPARGLHKIFIVKNAETLTAKTANALLKTLEEPPADVIFLLLAPSISLMLPTIVSRSQVVRFPAEDQEKQAEELVQKLGITQDEAFAALSITKTSAAAALYLSSADTQLARTKLLQAIACISQFSTWQLLEVAKDVSSLAVSGAEVLPEEVDFGEMANASKSNERDTTVALPSLEGAEIQKEFLSSKAQKEIEKNQKRARRVAAQMGMQQLLIAAELFLRDIIVFQMQKQLTLQPNSQMNAPSQKSSPSRTSFALPDTLETVQVAAQSWNLSQAFQGIKFVQAALASLKQNVAPRLAIEALLCHMEDLLCQK